MNEDANNIVPAVLYLKEASDLLQYEQPEISNCLLKLASQLLEQYKLDNQAMLSAENLVDKITAEEA